MSKRFLLAALAAFLLALSVPAWAQMTSVKGKISDGSTPLPGIKVEFLNAENGHKLALTTDKNGQYFSLGVFSGVYKVTLSKDGQTIWTQENVHIELEEAGNEINFDLAKLRAAAMSQPGQPQMTAEQLKKIEAAKKEKATVEALNQKLAAAKAAEDANDWHQAVTILTEATDLDPTRHQLWANLCQAQLGDKQYEGAVTACQKSIELAQMEPNADPVRIAQYRNNLGQAYVKTGKTQEAAAEYTSAAKADPAGASKYYFNLGAVLTNAFKTDEAIDAFDKAIAADPTYADAYYWKATNLINKAKVEKDPKTGKDRMVAPPGTAEAYQKYLELAPDGRYAASVKDVMAMIGAEVQTSYKKEKTKK